jgi:hypothetical protein
MQPSEPGQGTHPAHGPWIDAFHKGPLRWLGGLGQPYDDPTIRH